MTPLDPVREELLRNDNAFRTLFEEHQDCEHRLESIRQKSLPSEEDEVEIKRIKLHKLVLKDQMENIVRQQPVHA